MSAPTPAPAALPPATTHWAVTSASAPQDFPLTSSPVPATTSTSARPPRTRAVMAAPTRKGATCAAARPGTTEWDRGKAAPASHTRKQVWSWRCREVNGGSEPRRQKHCSEDLGSGKKSHQEGTWVRSVQQDRLLASFPLYR